MKMHLLAIAAVMSAMLPACAPSAPADKPPTVFDVPALANVAIDGKADDWAEQGFRIDLLVPPHRGWPRPVANHHVRLRLGWNDKGLLVLATIRDDKWMEDPKVEDLWQGDSLELYLAPAVGAKDVCHWLIAPGMSGEQNQCRYFHHELRTADKLKKLPTKIQLARTKADGQCVLEVLLPWSCLAIKPAPGREVGFQVYATDFDKPGTSLQSTWYPGDDVNNDPSQMYSLRLAERASPAVWARGLGRFDRGNARVAISAVADAKHAGKKIVVSESGRPRGSSAFAVDESTGLALATVYLPLPPLGRSYGPLTVSIAGRTIEAVTLPHLKRDRAEAILHTGPTAKPCVFFDERLPGIHYDQPLWPEAMIGAYKIKTTYYDEDYKVVTKAVAPGRYGAVAEVIPENGRPFRRFITLYRAPARAPRWGRRVTVSVELPREWGVPAAAIAAQPEAISNSLQWQVIDAAWRDDRLAVLLAGLSELKDTSRKDDYFNSPDVLDRQWWVGLKRKLYGWDKQFTKPLVYPRPIEGDPATVIRAGTLKEAGMKPDAVEKIDAALAEWAGDSDEAFAVCIARHGVIVLHKAYGTRNGKPMTVDTRSWMASLTKMFSGSLMMMLLDQGMIDMDEPIGKYLPPLRDVPTNKPLTIAHLYTHTADLRWHWGDRVNDMEERMAVLLPQLNVGSQYKYCGTDMELACKILEAVSGESLPLFYQKHLLGPLGCDNTTVGSATHDTLSVPLDIAKICQMLLNKGAYGKMRFFSAETAAKQLPRRLTATLGPKADRTYGYGTSWFSREGWGAGTFGHGAASSAIGRVDPTNDMVVVMTRNAAGENFDKYYKKFVSAVMESIAEKK